MSILVLSPNFCTVLRKRAIDTHRVPDETPHSVNGHAAIEV